MWDPVSWMEPMWGFWWVIPFLGLLVCLAFFLCAARALMNNGRFMCMGPGPVAKETGELKRKVRELREEVDRLKAAPR